jgi:hypothetical protein
MAVRIEPSPDANAAEMSRALLQPLFQTILRWIISFGFTELAIVLVLMAPAIGPITFIMVIGTSTLIVSTKNG